MICSHEGPCSAGFGSGVCATKQAAEASKYSVEVWHIHEFKPGWFGLFSSVRREVELITQDWNEVLRAYRARPPFVRVTREELRAPRVDLGKLEFKL